MLENLRLHSSFRDNICGADLAYMQLISKFIKGLPFYNVLLTFIVNMNGLFLLKKGITIANAFQKILNDSIHKPSKIWVDKGSELDK